MDTPPPQRRKDAQLHKNAQSCIFLLLGDLRKKYIHVKTQFYERHFGSYFDGFALPRISKVFFGVGIFSSNESASFFANSLFANSPKSVNSPKIAKIRQLPDPPKSANSPTRRHSLTRQHTEICQIAESRLTEIKLGVWRENKPKTKFQRFRQKSAGTETESATKEQQNRTNAKDKQSRDVTKPAKKSETEAAQRLHPSSYETLPGVKRISPPRSGTRAAMIHE